MGAETKRKYRRHPKPDENAPERPPSAYVIFSNKIRDDVKDQNLSFTQIAKLVGDRWQKLDPPGKEPYEAQANAAKEKYNILLSTYKKTESYREYTQYLAEFKAKHGGGAEQKRPRLEQASSGGTSSGKSLEVDAELLAPSQGHIRGSSTGSLSSTVTPSPASSQVPLPLQPHLPGLMGAASLRDGSSPRRTPSRDLPRLGQLSTQSSVSDESSAMRSDSDALVRTASLSLGTPPTGTPPLPPPVPLAITSDHSFPQEMSRLRYPGTGLQTGPGSAMQAAGQTNVGYGYSGTLPSPSMSEASLRSRGPDLRSYLDTGRSIQPTSYFASGVSPVSGTISLPPITGSADRRGGMAAQRVLPLPRSSPTAHHQPGYTRGSRASESPNPYGQGQTQVQGQGQGSASSPLERSESDAADALAGLAGFPSTSRPDTAKPWDPQRGWPHR